RAVGARAAPSDHRTLQDPRTLGPSGPFISSVENRPVPYDVRMDLTQFVEHHGGISVIRGGETVRTWNGIEYQAGLSAKNVNVKHLSMNVATVPPGAVAYAHVHVGFEVMLYILQGRVRHEFGDKLTQSVQNGPG